MQDKYKKLYVGASNRDNKICKDILRTIQIKDILHPIVDWLTKIDWLKENLLSGTGFVQKITLEIRHSDMLKRYLQVWE